MKCEKVKNEKANQQLITKNIIQPENKINYALNLSFI